MDWPVTSKPYAIAAGDGKVRSNSKIFLEIIYKVYFMSSIKPSSDPSTAIQTSIVDAM